MIKRTLIVLAIVLASTCISAEVVKMTPLETFVEGTNETLRAANAYTDAHSGGGGSGGVYTNAVIDIANATIATNATITTLTSDVSSLESTKADEFTAWGFSAEVSVSDALVGAHPILSYDPVFVNWNLRGLADGWIQAGPVTKDEDALVVDIPVTQDYSVIGYVTASRKRVLRTGDAATQQELTNTISTNNPAFVAAVQSIATPSPPSLRLYDEVRGCYWIGRMVNGVISWEVEE